MGGPFLAHTQLASQQLREQLQQRILKQSSKRKIPEQDSFGVTETSGTVKTVGHESARAKISNHTPEPVPARKTQSQLIAESKNRVEPEIIQADFKFKEPADESGGVAG